MRPARSRRILLVFAKTPEPGKVKTRLAEALGDVEAARIYRTLGRRVVDAVRGGDFRVVVYFDPPDSLRDISHWLGKDGLEFRPQPPGGLGVRLADGFAWAFLHADLVCAIGTDAPELERNGVGMAFDALSEPEGADVVFGPARDGGYYLVGLRRPTPSLFDGIPWSTSEVLHASLARARSLGLEPRLLRALSDVDRPEDIPEELRQP